MATTIKLEEGGMVVCTFASEKSTPGPLLRLELIGRGEPRGTAAYLWPGEIRELVVELLRRLKGGDDVARFPGWRNSDAEMPVISLDRLVNLVCGETVAPPPAGEKGGEPT